MRRRGVVRLGTATVLMLLCAHSMAAPAARAEAMADAPDSEGDLDGSSRGGLRDARAHILFTADLYGRFAWPGCGERVRNKAELAHLITAVHQLGLITVLQGDGKPLVLAAGSMIRPDVLGKTIFGAPGSLAAKGADVLTEVGFDAISLGPYDLGADPETLARYVRLMERRNVPLLAGNLLCEREHDVRCRALSSTPFRRPLIFERGGLRIGVISVLRQDLLRYIIAHSREGLAVTDPTVWTRRVLRRLRERENVDMVVVVADLNSEAEAPEPVLHFVRELGNDAPELVIANVMYERGSRAYLRELKRGHTTIVGTDRFGQHLGHAEVYYTRQAGRVRIQRIEVQQHETLSFTPEPSALRDLDVLMAALCHQLDRPLGRARLDPAMSQPDFVRYVMEIMRRQMKAEVALLNDGSTADTGFPLRGRLKREMLARALRTDTTVGYVVVLGSRVVELAKAPVGTTGPRLHVLGLSRRGSKWWVNGREVVAGQHYRVATTAFLAAGGEGLLSLKADERFHDSALGLREMVVAYFQRGLHRADGNDAVDVDADFPDLHDRWLLFSTIDAGLAFSNVTIANGARDDRYSLPLLQRDELTSLGIDVRLALGASTRNHALEADIQLQYGRTWTSTNDEVVAAESQDRVSVTLLYKLLQIRNIYAGSRWYLPEPYAEARLITELTPSGTLCRDPACSDVEAYRYMDLGGTLGVGLNPHPLLFVKAGAVMRGELLTPAAKNPDITARPGIYLGYLLRRIELFGGTAHPIAAESRLDFYMTDLTGTLRKELTVQSRLLFALTWRLHLTATHQLYLFDANDRDVSTANDIAFGIAISFDVRRQLH